MTTNSMTLIQAIQQGGEAEVLRQLAETALVKLMVVEVEQVVGAAKGQPAPAARTTSRQGYRERPRPTRWHTLE